MLLVRVLDAPGGDEELAPCDHPPRLARQGTEELALIRRYVEVSTIEVVGDAVLRVHAAPRAAHQLRRDQAPVHDPKPEDPERLPGHGRFEPRLEARLTATLDAQMESAQTIRGHTERGGELVDD